MTPRRAVSADSFVKQQELAVLDTALGYLVRDKIIDNSLRAKYLNAWGEKTLAKAVSNTASSERRSLRADSSGGSDQ